MSGHRVAHGGLIDRDRPLRFRFDGRALTGLAGDTLASALMANGVRVVGRSFKYHRPRGLWGAWVEEPNAVMTVAVGGRAFANCLATTTPLREGMEVRAVNAWPSAAFDLKGGLDLLHRWFPAGFYYKTFMWPRWHLYEPMIRRMAGLGALDPGVDESYRADQVHERCETLVIGGGAAGLAAARDAVEAGQDTVLVEDHAEAGGGLYQRDSVEGAAPADWIAAQCAAIEAGGGRILTATTATGVYDHRMVALVRDRGFGAAPCLIRMRAGRIVLATGALDRPIAFDGNDSPGILSLGAGCEYLARHGVLAGRDIVVLATGPRAEAARDLLQRAGARVGLLDPASGHARALGRWRLTGIALGRARHRADTVLVSGGLTPTVHLWCHAGGRLAWCDARQAFLPGAAPEGMLAVGAANGSYDLDATLAEARAAGAGRPVARPDPVRRAPALWPRPGARGRQWIDLQHDVTLRDVELAARENFVSVEHLKRYTTLGMATDQGKSSNMAGLAAMAAIRGQAIAQTGTTTFRPPYVPVPVEAWHGARGGQLWQPLKRLPLEALHRAAGAALGEYGGWLRPGWYGGPGEGGVRAQAEALMARRSAGLFDASALGKIEVMGPDAASFVNFIYCNRVDTLGVGRIRYGLMLTEAGAVFDDGVIARLGADRFVISCSSSHTDAVETWLEAWRQDGNDPERVFVHDTTQHWATIAVSGPEARAIVGALGLDLDLAPAALPHMSLRETAFDGTPLRVARVSFTGDLCFELSIRASSAAGLWQRLVEAARPLGAGPIGIEALAILRAEKGFIMIGKDTDGETMPHDLGLAGPRDTARTVFVGDRGLHSERAADPARKALVGLAVPDGQPPLPTGAHLVAAAGSPRSQGYVTSSYVSPNLGRPIALGLLEGGAGRLGERLAAWHLGQCREVTVCARCAFDPGGERLDA